MRTLLLTLLLSLAGIAQASPFDHSHFQWSTLLAKHVTWINRGVASEADYLGFKQDEVALKRYLTNLSNVTRDQYDGWSREQQLSFLINSYNAFTVKLIIEHYPVASIKDIGGLFSSPWKQAFIPLLGKTLTLDQLEHALIQAPGKFDDPRIHFAVNCASVGCPALRPRAFVASRLHAQLEDSQRRFLSDRSRNRFDSERGVYQISKIFDWYGEDFAKRWGSLEEYLSQHSSLLTDHERQSQLSARSTEIEYLDYDWSLNKAR
ncbi:DUF547 domain-containing protein [Pseudomonas sp. GD03696]|uniref:DUF547 domain-containing protein n=1 Tax=Pseudomonas sp. GD03696 TaxID=2975368 RepID=UPI00244C24D2|nr:DUF547 domain-containing protein [Pseudomonas sp. GD03696]MDH1932811.1 DUF547 domain-containing protein [Pseudomonas sp. GD03696]